MTTASKPRNLPLLIVLAVIAFIVIVSVVVVATRSGSVAVDPNSPEGVVQRYTEAILDDDRDAARTLLAPRIAEDCTTTEPYVDAGTRVVLLNTRTDADRRIVNVEVSTPGGGGIFGPSDYVSRESFTLEPTDDGWGVASAPWRFTICEEMWQ